MLGLVPFTKSHSKSLFDFFNVVDDCFDNDFYFNRRSQFDTFRLDVIKKDDAYLVEAELPGIAREDISLNYDNNLLTIEVKQEESTSKESNYIYRERRFLSMSRTIQLKNVDEEKIEAKLDNGILKITAPILENIKNKKNIDIL